METDVRRNPALLKLDLYCRGMRMDDSCFIHEDGGRQILRTRAGLGSGLELILPGGLWTNVPVTENFAASSPYVLHRENGLYVIRRYREASRGSGQGLQVTPGPGEPVGTVRLAPRPGWYEKKTRTGKPMTRVGTLQGTYLGVYPAKVCEYWTAKPQKANCKFCSVGLNLGVVRGTVNVDIPVSTGGAQRVQVQVPQVVSFRLHERFRWPANQVLMLGCGVVASPTQERMGPLGLPLPPLPMTGGGRADALVMIESNGKAGQTLLTADTVAILGSVDIVVPEVDR